VEFKLISENKLKIVLTNEDMASLDITCEEIYNEDINTKRVFLDIYDKAKRLTGFTANAVSEKIVVEVQDRKSEGCYIYVTKLNPQKSDTYEKRYKKFYTSTKKRRLLYIFENSETLFEACKQLILIGYNGKSDIFVNKEKYFLYIEDNREQSLDLISEYGFLINNPFFGFYLDEHAKKILSADAVQAFSEIFK